MVLERFAFGVIGDFQQRFEFVPLRRAQVFQNHVLPQLQADDFGLGMQRKLGHGRQKQWLKAVGWNFITICLLGKFLVWNLDSGQGRRDCHYL